MNKGRDTKSHGAGEVEVSLARREIERLLRDPRLKLSHRHRAFLEYLAEQYYLGHPRKIKGYTIAIDVFGRPESFDPATDPIVRIEAARLRAALENYYDAYYDTGDIRVSLPRGQYVIEFSFRSAREIDDGFAVGTPHERRRFSGQEDTRLVATIKNAFEKVRRVLRRERKRRQ